METHGTTLTDGAILYAIRELGRRAGAGAESIARWRVQRLDDAVRLFPIPGSSATIEFPLDPSKDERFERLAAREPSQYEKIVVPFEDQSRTGAPFERTGAETIRFRADVIAATFWILTRREEYGPVARDEHGRFLGVESAAHRHGYLRRPVVDEYGEVVREALSLLMPGWAPTKRSFRVKISHDMDTIGLPRNLRSTVKLLYPRGLPGAFIRDAVSAVRRTRPAYLQAAWDMGAISKQRGLDSAFYWKASGRKTFWDTGYDLNDPVIRSTIYAMLGSGFELGLHPAYDTFGSDERLQEEVQRLRSFVGDRPVGGRTHFLRWNPSTWTAWNSAGLAYDSTLGFHDLTGFRCGTCIPYHAYSLEEDRELPLLEIPLIVMDCTPVLYMDLDDAATLEDIATMIERCRAVGGVFTLLWHNTNLLDAPFARLYPPILNMLGPHEKYDLEADLPIAALPVMQRPPAAVG